MKSKAKAGGRSNRAPDSTDVPRVTLRETEGVPRLREPIRFGVPLPRGWLAAGRTATLVASDAALPCQGKVLARWPDGSAKWYLVSSVVDLAPHQAETLELRRDAEAAGGDMTVRVGAEDIEVDTGAARFRFARSGSALVERIERDGRALLAQPLVAKLLAGETAHTAAQRIRVLERGPARVVLRFEGGWESHDDLVWFGEMHLVAGSTTLRLDTTLRNRRPAHHPGGTWDLGDPGSAHLKALTLEMAANGPGDAALIDLNEGATFDRGGATQLSFLQESAGGEHWDSSSHIGADGRLTVRYRGFRVWRDGTRVGSGDRAQPVLSWRPDSGSGGLSLTVEHTWQNAPKGLAAQDTRLTVDLFPLRPDQTIELQGGEQKTHTVYIDAGGDGASLAWTIRPLAPRIDDEWVRRSGAVRYLNRPADDDALAPLIAGAIEGERSFFEKREAINEFGWRHFGELYADHEGVNVEGPPHLVSHYNNQYDPLFSLLRQTLIEGDARWWRLAEDLCRHLRDVDIYHTEQDRPEYNGAMFWHTDHYLDADTSTHRSFAASHALAKGSGDAVDAWGRRPNIGGGPGLQHCYARGLALHYLMTGELASREAVLTLAAWVRRRLRSPSTLLGALLEIRRTLPAIRQRLRGEKPKLWPHPLNRGSGNALHTLLDALLVSGDEGYLEDAERLIAGCAGTDERYDPIDERHLINSELNWSYTVLLEAIGRYLDVKLERGEPDAHFAHARGVLLRYAAWMGRHDTLYLDRRDALEFPNETWPAQDLRKAKVLLYAAQHAEPETAATLRERAHQIFDEALAQLRSFGQRARLTRPLVLLLQNYGMMLHYRQFGDRGQPDRRVDGLPPPVDARPRSVGRAIWATWRDALRQTTPRRELRWLGHRLRGRRSRSTP